jgi:light-regulated signal transduction histidine kinase (bacteriophytochrome)
MAIRTGKPQTDPDFPNTPSPALWRDEAIKRGYQSTLGLPLQIEGVVLGALTIYSAEPNGFSAEEVGLLENLAHNLAFGIDRLRAKVRLAVANKELQAFTYAASHDLKAPLGRINSFSTLLEQRCRSQLDEDGLKFLEFIQQNSARLTTLVDDLLTHAQVEQQNVNLQRIDLRAAVQAVLHELKEEIVQKGAEICLDLPPVDVQADPFDLAQVLHNLLSNALKYSGVGKAPVIQIGGEARKGCFRFWVRDNGIGFDMVYRDRIFEIFRRLHAYSEYPGNGIGLALVKKAVGRMKGNVWAESRPGQGATFYVELPA